MNSNAKINRFILELLYMAINASMEIDRIEKLGFNKQMFNLF